MAFLRRIPLLAWIILAIILGILTAGIMPAWLARIFLTYNSIFSGLLAFVVPLIIVGLVMPAIAELGQGAGRWLAVTAGIAYGSTLGAGLLAYFVARWLFTPSLAGAQMPDGLAEADSGLTPYFSVVAEPGDSPTQIVLAPMIEVLPALVFAFIVGIGMTAVRSNVLLKATLEFRSIIELTVSKVIVPALPLFIFGIFMDLTMSGAVGDVLNKFALVVIVAISLTFVVLLLQYGIAGAIARVNPFKALWRMRNAYATALGTSSSAATIPVTLKSTLSNNVSEPVAGFVVPLCATIHLSGSMAKITTFSMAILLLSGGDVSFGAYFPFILMLGVMMIAAPGVPGGAIAAASGLLTSMLGFDQTAVGLMFATYIALDSIGTATNVTGDGAIALIVNKLSRGKLAGNAGDGETGHDDAVAATA